MPIRITFRRAAKFSATIGMGRASQPRQIEGGDTCASLAEAVALAIAVAIDPQSLLRNQAPPQAATPHREVPPSAHNWKAEFSAATFVSAGLSPSFAPGVAISGGARTMSYRLGIEGRTQLESQLALNGGGELYQSIRQAGAYACKAVLGRPNANIALCLHALTGVINGQTRGLSSARSQHRFFATTSASAKAEWSMATPWTLFVQLEAGVTPTPTSLKVDNVAVWKTPLWNALARVGIGFVY